MSDITMSKPDEEMAPATTTTTTQTTAPNPNSSPAGKGKGKEKQRADDSMELEEDEDEEEDEEEEEEDDDDEDAEDFSEIDPKVIIPTDGGRPRRNRPVVDYSSKEAMAKAGVDPSKVNEEDD